MKATIRHDITTASGPHRINQRVDLDEVVIPGRIHIEDMGGYWHVALGGDALILSVGPKGVTIVEENKVRR
jgi:hypothetical protein